MPTKMQQKRLVELAERLVVERLLRLRLRLVVVPAKLAVLPLAVLPMLLLAAVGAPPLAAVASATMPKQQKQKTQINDNTNKQTNKHNRKTCFRFSSTVLRLEISANVGAPAVPGVNVVCVGITAATVGYVDQRKTKKHKKQNK